jgi:hypothetical protein
MACYCSKNGCSCSVSKAAQSERDYLLKPGNEKLLKPGERRVLENQRLHEAEQVFDSFAHSVPDFVARRRS